MRPFTLPLKSLRVHKKKRISDIFRLACLSITAALLCCSCAELYTQPVVIWTNSSEFAAYAELFNAQQHKARAVVMYKENPAESLRSGRHESAPDIVAGSWLNNDQVRSVFMPIDYLFTDRLIDAESFYPCLREAGKSGDHYYLLPVSFNLPAVIFAKTNSSLIAHNYMLSLNQIRAAGAQYNRQNDSSAYTRMGFAPRWKSEFLVLAAQIMGADFHGSRQDIVWSQQCLDDSAAYLRSWTADCNTSTAMEEDFKFKYLYTPDNKQVTSGRCLFSYISSRDLFTMPQQERSGIDFRWICEDSRIPIEDDMVFMGIHRDSRNLAAAEIFITWFMQEESQRQMMERIQSMHLETEHFGIAGGFSALRTVTERVFPTYYTTLLANLPPTQSFIPPQQLPFQWESFKTRVLTPYLMQAADTAAAAPSLETLVSQWATEY